MAASGRCCSISGGGRTTGSGSEPLDDGVRLCKRGDVVMVTVTHRLNLFGHLSLAQLGDASFADSGNAGQLDLIQALQWVCRHAAEFGGCVGNVTVFGQSGGGAKIATLMAMPATRGLFHRAWTMSGQHVTVAGPRAATQHAQLLPDALKMSPSEVARMHALPVAQLLAAAQVRDPSPVENNALYFGPVLDARKVPVHPFWPTAPLQSARVPMVIGNTRDATRGFLGNDAKNFALRLQRCSPRRRRSNTWICCRRWSLPNTGGSIGSTRRRSCFSRQPPPVAHGAAPPEPRLLRGR